MSHPRYFLVRREAREFIGPMTIDEFKQRFDRLEFGMQDEVSGHCGPWVVLDHRDDMLKHYPEIARVFGENLPLSWRETTGHAKVISRKDTRKDKRNELEQQKKARTDFHRYMELRKRQAIARTRMALLTVVVSLVIGAWIVLNKDETPELNEIQALAQKSDPTEFLNVMGVKVIPQAARLSKSQKMQPVWLPYLRMYAFYTTGSIEGVSQKLLRGDVSPALPTDCSVDFWKRKWRENVNSTLMFIQGTSMQKNPWTKLLSIDPDWVRRRPSKGWSKPRSYVEGCLMTAHTAMRSMSSEKNSDNSEFISMEVSSGILARLRFQLDAINGNRTNVPNGLTGLLAQLTCFETQAALVDLEQCRRSFDQQFKPLFDERYASAVLRLVIASKNPGLEKSLTALVGNTLPRMVTEDFMSRLDMAPEIKLMGYLNSYGDVEQALVRIGEEYPEMSFKPI